MQGFPLAFIRKYFSQFESNCGCNRLLKLLAAKICKKFKKRYCARRSVSTDKLYEQYGSEETVFDLWQEDIDHKHILKVISTHMDERALEVMENDGAIARYVDNFLLKYERDGDDWIISKRIDNEDVGKFTRVDFKSTDNLLNNNQNEDDEPIFDKGIDNAGMERSMITDFELIENLSIDYKCRATGPSNFEEASNEEAGWISPVNFKSTYNLFANYKSEENESIVAGINDEVFGRITPPAIFQTAHQLLMNDQNEAEQLNISEELINLKPFENLLIDDQTRKLNADQWTFTSDNKSKTPERQKSLDVIMQTETEQDVLLNTPVKVDIEHVDVPKVVGVKYSPIVYKAINAPLSEEQKSTLEQDDNNSEENRLEDLKAKRRSAYVSINRDYSLIIRDLVMERFGKALKQCNARRFKRQLSRQSSSSSSGCDNKSDMDTATTGVPLEPHVKVYFNRADEMVSSTDSGLEDMTTEMLKGNSSDTGDSSEEGKETVEYDSQEFLREALGDEYLNATYESQDKFDVKSPPIKPQRRSMYSTERSIGSSDISMLISNTEGSKSEGIYSLYSTIRKPAKKRAFMKNKTRVVQPLFSSVSTHYDYDYASIDIFRINPKVEELIKEVSHLQNIIDQVSKALLFCRDKPKFFGDIPHIEAEKLLLLSTYKKELLNNEINKDEYEELEQGQRVGTVKILNLKCSTKPEKAAKKKEIRYYLCLLHSGINVLASEIVTPEANGDVTFPPNCFEFKELVSDFEIHISIYGMNLEKHENKKNMSRSPRSSFRSKKNIDSDPLTSFFQLVGSCKIGISDLSQHIIKLKNIPHNATINHKLAVNIKSSLEIKNKTGGFLNIGNNSLMWNRRWCVLDGSYLKYWNYPSDENDMEPIGMFDLSFCMTYPVNRVNKSVCARSRTFMLEMVEGTVRKTYLFSADSLTEFEEWKRQLNSILITLRNWNKLKY